MYKFLKAQINYEKKTEKVSQKRSNRFARERQLSLQTFFVQSFKKP